MFGCDSCLEKKSQDGRRGFAKQPNYRTKRKERGLTDKLILITTGGILPIWLGLY